MTDKDVKSYSQKYVIFQLELKKNNDNKKAQKAKT